MHNLAHIWLVMLSFSLPLSAQTDLGKDQSFFEARAREYQDWLEDSGLDQILKVKTIRIEEEATLFLAFHTEDANTCWIQWQALEDQFGRTSPVSLAERLFHRMVASMNLAQELALIRLYDTYDLAKKPCFSGVISFSNGQVRQDITRCKKKKITFNGHLETLTVRQPVSRVFHSNLDSEVLTDLFYHYAKNKYQNHYCCSEDMKANIKVLENTGNKLRLRIDDVKKQILAEGRAAAFCETEDCEEINKEQLFFTVVFEPLTPGTRMNITLDAAYGKDVDGSRGRAAYTFMGASFDEALADYATEVTNDIHRIILDLGRP